MLHEHVSAKFYEKSIPLDFGGTIVFTEFPLKELSEVRGSELSNSAEARIRQAASFTCSIVSSMPGQLRLLRDLDNIVHGEKYTRPWGAMIIVGFAHKAFPCNS